MNLLSPDHFLSLPRPDILFGPPQGVPDTTTLAAHDFDVDNRTGFMPPQPPLARLPAAWESWEQTLDEAVEKKLQLGDKPGLSQSEMMVSQLWRWSVRELPILPITDLKKSELTLRRAHHVLSFILHLYIHSLPPSEPVHIPPPITLPLLQVSAQLQLPPVNTYSDNVLNNWALKSPSSAPTPALDNLRCLTLFTSTKDEEEFFLVSARMELRGVEALELMRATMDEAFVGDDLAMRRITTFLHRMSTVINELKVLLLSVREGCNPEVFYRQIRPWFKGADPDQNTHRRWVFEGLEQDPNLSYPEELSGPSAGQSSLIHALDVFLGVEQYSHSSSITGSSSTPSPTATKQAFLKRMQSYMPRHHRNFLNHLSSNPRPLRSIVESADSPQLLEAYNAAVLSLKELRDAHLIIVTMYIVSPARKAQKELEAGSNRVEEAGPLKGTGGTELMKFLKDVRNGTAAALIPSS